MSVLACGWHRYWSRFPAFTSFSLRLQQCGCIFVPRGMFSWYVQTRTPVQNKLFQKRYCGQLTLISFTEVSYARKLSSKLIETTQDAHTLLVIQPDYKHGVVEKPYVPAENKLEEAVRLAEAITGWEVQSTRVDILRQPHNKFLFGKGKISELKTAVKQLPISGIFINTPKLTPLQQRSLEELFQKDVFDRFSIVLRIFKERARTREAKVQVELAEIPYLRSLILGKEGEFDQQKGGTGKTGGAGETSLEISRRALLRREKALREELNVIRAKRTNLRNQRVKHSLPVVAVVGYTNAGKTTLIKTLSKDERLHPKDMLFATLDTTMHAGKLPCGLRVLYVDTIGFISDLPHELVESFASTLEDVTSADVIVHVCDASHPKSYAQRANVLNVLRQLNVQPQLLERMIEVLNKADRVEKQLMINDPGKGLPVSATEGFGLIDLMLSIEDAVLKATNRKLWMLVVPVDGPHLSWLHHEATVCNVRSSQHKEQLEVEAILSEATLGKFKAKFGDSVIFSDIAHD